MEKFYMCMGCCRRENKLWGSACGHKILCYDCSQLRRWNCDQCECDQIFDGRLLIFEANFESSSFQQLYEEKPNINQLKFESLKPKYLKYIYKSLLDSSNIRQEFLNIVQNLIFNTKCFKCPSNEMKYFSLIDEKGFCSSCRNYSSIHIDSPVFPRLIQKQQQQANQHLTVYMLTKMRKTLRNERNSFKIYSHQHIFLKYGKKIDGLTKICPACFSEFDYKVRVPLTFECKSLFKHVICSQCYFSNIERCPFDEEEIRKVRIFHELSTKVECFNKCGYFGALYHRFNYTHYLCEKCYHITMSSKEPLVKVKQCLMFFKLLCKKHRRITNFFDKNKFEALCYNCCDDFLTETSTEQLYQLIEDKEKWIKQELIHALNPTQKVLVNEMNLDKFSSLRQRYEQIKQLEMMLNEFWFEVPTLLNSYKQINLLLVEPEKKFYSELINFLVNHQCKLLGILIEKYAEIESFCIDLLQDGEFVYRLYKNIENNNQQEVIRVFLDDDMHIFPDVSYSLLVSFHVRNDFIFYKRAKRTKNNEYEMIQNGITLKFKITSRHERKVLVQGLILSSNS